MIRRPYLPTGINQLDYMLGGGLPTRDITLIYGEATSGKTTLAVKISLLHLKQDPATKAMYVDSDNKLNHSRLEQIEEHTAPNLLHRLQILTPQTYSEQTSLIQELTKILEPGDITIIDSITGLYRIEAGDESKVFIANKELNRQLGYIKEMAIITGSSFVLTGQVRSLLDSKGIEPVATRLLNHWSHTVIKLEKTPTQNQRQATIEKPEIHSNTLYLFLSDKGLEEWKP